MMMAQVNNRPVLSISRQKFAVVFNLDISYSMNGSRWNAVKNSVRNFIQSMQQDDLVSCLVFNDKVTLITK